MAFHDEDETDREMACKRVALRIRGELELCLAAMPRIVDGVDKYDFEYGTPSPVDELEGLLGRLEPVTTRIVDLSRRMR